ncbi:tetratricopeptide repeat protein [Massilia solisilvae]|uniref:Tetratricopeptide repeat protein n=1 Tax=Massilia solisilvae TaxID=1811225 RepID=A0ABT2BEB4_9BURK|nr:tetratricopeptide repeat protein [Massilia solisilvae]MCS0606751.1 tetratricopeptide repeat protein [Massilia solisilvae]
MMRRPAHLAAALALAAAHTLAHGQARESCDAGALRQDLYQNALQSIAEGRRSDASRELRCLIENEPQHAGAWLDLAMTQCALGHSEEAERLFATIETRFAPSRLTPGWEEMLRLIAEAREEGCNRWHPASAWSFTAGRGVDQNVNQGALSSTYISGGTDGPIVRELSSDFRPMHDQYSLLSGDYTRDITPNGTTGFAQYVVRRNDRLRQYDSASAFAGVDTPWRVGRWTLRGSAAVGLVTLGSRLYQRQLQLQARVTPPLPLPTGMQASVLTGFAYNEFLTLSNFNSNIWDTRAQLTWRRPNLFASASAGRLLDHALAARPGGDRHGWFGNLLVKRHLGGNLAGELSFTRQTWSSTSPYSPGLIDEVRAQGTNVARASLMYTLTRNQSIQLEGRVVRNRENISIFQYNSRQLQLSWQWQGF